MLEQATAALVAVGVPTPRVDAELLLAWATDTSRGAVQARAMIGGSITPEHVERFRQAVARRATREPLQHITGQAYFRALTLAVGPGVFVPRPETEGVVQFGIDALRATALPEPIAVDLGSGSGAIAIAMDTEVPNALVYAVERSADALPWTRRNVDAHGGTVRLVEGDLADALPELDGTVSVVVSNPPYVPDDAVPIDPEVRDHDPAMALYGGPDGLDSVRALAETAWRLLVPGGVLVIEHAEPQGAGVREVLTRRGFRTPETHVDLTGRDRTTTATR
ncbi:peptide chain release factor N(5)-glutamine methyltransferase [Curtobacterium flaccumfaciens pv. flaccumfaciens]|uniref:Release factor glutamine methyltransferase n=1 Tax=Curtobacterium aurantiacum TaxID=3236919 RepID=A0ABS5VJY5_9MICO|nr:peptide chain release factor N(5)-glutamine methyltransferase [Curtobacterium flaccumfaciens]MBT1546634.1 peptide chain release factor N(5)-glutamine methyltransferase [Curtobacterium flaccumfaciens pv. flaccumfaciens]MBT1589374.1 peptide chain release factor N(5)-glutamine methyltransferase [Curtobacterium flaccumfaciens pv. flaccumfaciens]MBT1678163.1 peptide chain release factor N(5)-glutamine methyltransferase [Curtobacterium flaccumfaciens pv. flaccumfaciens]